MRRILSREYRYEVGTVIRLCVHGTMFGPLRECAMSENESFDDKR